MFKFADLLKKNQCIQIIINTLLLYLFYELVFHIISWWMKTLVIIWSSGTFSKITPVIGRIQYVDVCRLKSPTFLLTVSREVPSASTRQSQVFAVWSLPSQQKRTFFMSYPFHTEVLSHPVLNKPEKTLHLYRASVIRLLEPSV